MDLSKLHPEARAALEVRYGEHPPLELVAAVGHAAKESRGALGFGRIEIEKRSGADVVNVRGHATVFNHAYDIGGMWTEIMAPGATKRSISTPGAKIFMLVSHDGLPVAATHNGTLRLAEDSVGLESRAALDVSSPGYVKDAAMAIEDGRLSEMSIGFWVVRDLWDWSTDVPTRTIHEIKLVEVSAVPLGANDATDIGVDRSDEEPDTEASAEVADEQRAKHPGAVEATRLLALHHARRLVA